MIRFMDQAHPKIRPLGNKINNNNHKYGSNPLVCNKNEYKLCLAVAQIQRVSNINLDHILCQLNVWIKSSCNQQSSHMQHN